MAVHYGGMAGKESARGPTADTVRANIKAIRKAQNLNYTQVSERLAPARAISAVGVRRVESGERRVDVDDLAAFAVALGVSPITLLMPQAENRDDEVTVTGVNDPQPALTLWLWLLAEMPMRGDRRIPLAFQFDTRPSWWWEYQGEREEQNESERRASDRNLVEAGFMTAEQILAQGKSPDGDDQ